MTPIQVVGSQAVSIPPQPPSPPFMGSTLVGAARAYASGGKKAAVESVVSSVLTRVPIVGDILGGQLAGFIGGFIETKSKANWDRTLGRVYRAAVLGYVPPVDTAAAIGVMQRLKEAWRAAGDSTGAQFWDRVVAFFNVPTEKGGTKEGFASGAPAGSKAAEARPGFKSALTLFLQSVG